MTEHPGRKLGDLLTKRKIGPNRLAIQLGVPVNRLTRVMKGEQPITIDTALRLSDFFRDVPAEQWLQLQLRHDLAVARANRAAGTQPRQRRDAPR